MSLTDRTVEMADGRIVPALALYNEIDDYAADWLRNLIRGGHIAPGIVDQRSITEITPDDLAGFTQCHFFAGIGIWSHALRRAGWADDRPIWSGSCPCQPFSIIGNGGGFNDPRHLWPAWRYLISERRPPVIVGEQSSNAGEWLDLVAADLEDFDYAFGAALLRASGFEGAHERPRWYFSAVEHARGPGLEGHARHGNHATGRTKPARPVAAASVPHGPAWIGGDGIFRPIEPGLSPVAHEDPTTMGRLHAYGNALDGETATNFIAAVLDVLDSPETSSLTDRVSDDVFL